jgi:hypothetical protein
LGIAGLSLTTDTVCEIFSQKKAEGLHFKLQVCGYFNMVPDSACTGIQLLSCFVFSIVPLYIISKLFYKLSSFIHAYKTVIHIKVPSLLWPEPGSLSHSGATN